MSDTLPLKAEITDPETVRAATRRFKPSGSSQDVGERSDPTPSNSSNLKPPIIIGSPSLLHQRPIDGLETVSDPTDEVSFLSQDQHLRALSVALMESNVQGFEEVAIEELCRQILHVSELSNIAVLSFSQNGAIPMAWATYDGRLSRAEVKYFKTSVIPLAVVSGLISCAEQQSPPSTFRNLYRTADQTSQEADFDGWWRSNPWLERARVYISYDRSRKEGLAFIVATDSRTQLNDGFLDALERPLEVASSRIRLSYRSKVSERLYVSLKRLMKASKDAVDVHELAAEIASSFHNVVSSSYCYVAIIDRGGDVAAQSLVGTAISVAGDPLDSSYFELRLKRQLAESTVPTAGARFVDASHNSGPSELVDPSFNSIQAVTTADFNITSDQALKCFINFGLSPNRFHWSDFEREQLDEIAATVELVIKERASTIRQSSILSELELKATTDRLTHLPNREVFLDRAKQALIRSRRAGTRIAIAFLDVNNFKLVNDLYGHEVGDKLLVEVARRFSEAFRSVDTAARLSGDEFAALLIDIESENHAQAVCQRVLSSMSRTVEIGDLSLDLTASIGLALSDSSLDAEPEAAIDQLLNHADTAMYRAKVNRSTTIELFQKSVSEDVEPQDSSIELKLSTLQVSIVDGTPTLFELSGTKKQSFRTLYVTDPGGQVDQNILADHKRTWTSSLRHQLWGYACAQLGKDSGLRPLPPVDEDETVSVSATDCEQPNRLVIPMITEDLFGTVLTAKVISDISKASGVTPSNMVLSFDAGDLTNASDSANKALRSLRLTTGTKIMVGGDTEDLLNLTWLLDMRPEFLHLRGSQMSNRTLVDTVGIIGRSLKLTFTYS